MTYDPTHGLPEPLTERELEIVSLLAQGKTNQEIARELVLSLNTIKWYARQIYEKLGVTDRQQAVQRVLALGLLPAAPEGPLPVHNLPAQFAPFVGRRSELAQLDALLGDPQTRLITLAGPGGIGKTRLALQAAANWLYRNPDTVPDGVYFLPLAEIADAHDVAGALAGLVGLAPAAEVTGAALRLSSYLRSKQMLLLLDNAEHLVGPDLSAWLDTLLREAAGVSILVTSRRSLDLRGEPLVWVGGLRLPQEAPGASPTQLQDLAVESSALSLFLQTARRSFPGFDLADENAAAVIAICNAVEAMPLGIELAAAWMGVLAPGELLQELQHSPDILVTASGNVPAGQRSLRAVFDTSWHLLNDSEREAVRALSIFRGGFTRPAAREVCEIGPSTLLALVNKSWLARGEDGRFSLHQLLHQYGREALESGPEPFLRVRLRHGLYYCHWLAEQHAALCSPAQRAAHEAITLEMGNVRLACRTALEMGQVEPLRRAVQSLGQYFRWTGRFVEGDKFFAALLQALEASAEAPPSVGKLRARLLVWRMSLRSFLGHSEESEGFAREAEAVLARLEQAGEAMYLERLSVAIERGYNRLLRQRRPHEALTCFLEARALAQKIGSPWEEGHVLLALARVQRNLQQLDEAERTVVNGIELLREHGSEAALAEATVLHGNILLRLGRLQEAEALLEGVSALAITDPEIEAYQLVHLGWVRLLLGQFDLAEQPLMQGVARYEELESAWASLWAGLACAVSIHRGHYQAAVELAGKVLVPPRAPANVAEVQAIRDFVLGQAAMAEQNWSAARHHQERSLAGRQPTAEWHHNSPNACLAWVARRSGADSTARRHLAAELELALASRSYPSVILSLLVGALLWADRGNTQRAATLYARVWQETYARNSVWLQYVAGRELEEIAGSLPAAAREAAQRQGHELDLWATAPQLLKELSTPQ